MLHQIPTWNGFNNSCVLGASSFHHYPCGSLITWFLLTDLSEEIGPCHMTGGEERMGRCGNHMLINHCFHNSCCVIHNSNTHVCSHRHYLLCTGTDICRNADINAYSLLTSDMLLPKQLMTHSEPTLLVWTWSENAFPLQRSQNAASFVNDMTQYTERKDIQISFTCLSFHQQLNNEHCLPCSGECAAFSHRSSHTKAAVRIRRTAEDTTSLYGHLSLDFFNPVSRSFAHYSFPLLCSH